MSTIAVNRVISAPVEQVWQTFTDIDVRRSWLPDVVDIDVLTLGEGDGELAPGTQWRETRAYRSALLTEELEVVAVDPGRRVVLALAGGGDAGQLTYTFTPVEVGPRRGSTTVTVSTQRRPHGLANRVLSVLVAGFAARTAEGALRSELEALAQACRREWCGATGSTAA